MTLAVQPRAQRAIDEVLDKRSIQAASTQAWYDCNRHRYKGGFLDKTVGRVGMGIGMDRAGAQPSSQDQPAS